MITNDDMFCNFINISEKIYECAKCGMSIEVQDQIDGAPLVPCMSPLKNFSSTNARTFMEQHRPQQDLCSIEEIDHRHDICLSCDSFKNNSCEQCGCSLTRDRNYMNKLAIKTESCPIKKW